MSYKLKKPYKNEEQRLDFIVKYNHQMGLLIKETSKALYALEENEIMENNVPVINPNYEAEQEELNRKEQIETLKEQLNELDTKRIRAICENEIKDESSGQTWLEYYNEQVIILRNELKELQK